MMRRRSDVGLAFDDHCAIEVVDDTYRVITSQPDAAAYKLFKWDGELSTQRIEEREEYQPIAGLLRRASWTGG